MLGHVLIVCVQDYQSLGTYRTSGLALYTCKCMQIAALELCGVETPLTLGGRNGQTLKSLTALLNKVQEHLETCSTWI
jgi:hypothetical protein